MHHPRGQIASTFALDFPTCRTKRPEGALRPLGVITSRIPLGFVEAQQARLSGKAGRRQWGCLPESATCAAQTPKHQLSASENSLWTPPMGISASLRPIRPPPHLGEGGFQLKAWEPKHPPVLLEGGTWGPMWSRQVSIGSPVPLFILPGAWEAGSKGLGTQSQGGPGENEAWPGQTAAQRSPLWPGRPRVQGGSASRGLD